MGNIKVFVDRMRWWAAEGNLGYDQSNRWNIQPGGECDCSSLVIHTLREAGFQTGAATYTGNMSRELTALGWVRHHPGIDLEPGDIMLNDANHVAVYLGDGMLAQASIDERGRIAGGRSGDQSDYETNVRPIYDYPWNAYLRWAGVSTEVDIHGATTWNPNAYDEQYVRQVQALLNASGYNLEIDGVLGPLSFAAIKEYQAKKGLLVDGIPGPETLGTLKSAHGTPPASRVSQYLLTVDGVIGSHTITRLQTILGTPADGEISSQWVGHKENWPAAGTGWEWGEASEGSPLIRELQRRLGDLTIDGLAGPQTITALQRHLNVTPDSYCGEQTAKALQTRINDRNLF